MMYQGAAPRGTNFRMYSMQNVADPNVLDSLGGLESTINPMEKSLTDHELRPYDI